MANDQDKRDPFDLDFDGDDAFGQSAGTGKGTAAQQKAPPSPASDAHSAFDDEFETFPEQGGDFGAGEPAPFSDDGFGDVGHGAAAFDAPPGDEAAFGGDPIEDFDGGGAQSAAGRAAVDGDDAIDDADFDAVDENFDEGEVAGDEEGVEALTGGEDEELPSDAEFEEDMQQADGGKAAMLAGLKEKAGKYAVPAGALAAVGMVGYFGWGLVSSMFFEQAPAPQAASPQMQQHQVGSPPNNVPPMPGKTGSNGGAGTQPQRQAQSQFAPPPSQISVPSQPSPASSQPPSGGTGGMAQPERPAQPSRQMLSDAPAVGPDMTGRNRPDDAALSKLGEQIDQFGRQFQTAVSALSAKIDTSDRANAAARDALSQRMDALETRVASAPAARPAVPAPFGGPVAAPPRTQASSDAGEFPPLRSGGASPPIRSGAAEKPVAEKPSARVSRDEDDEDDRPKAKRSKQRRAAAARVERDVYPDDVAQDEPQAKPRVIGGYRLRGVSEVGGRAIAVVSSGRGRVEEVAMGQELPGAGTVQTIRQNGGRWVVVTTRGVIVE